MVKQTDRRCQDEKDSEWALHARISRRGCEVQDICCRHQALRQFESLVDMIEDYVGDDVLVRFGEMIVTVPPEMLEATV